MRPMSALRTVKFNLGAIKNRYSTVAPSNIVFDRDLKRRQRIYALSHNPEYDYLRDECAERLVDRLDDILRTFPTALELGSHRGNVAASIRSRNGPDGDTQIGGISTLFQSEMAHSLLGGESFMVDSNGLKTKLVRINEEDFSFGEQSVDLVLSSLALHWVNDLPGLLKGILSALRPDGAFIGCMLGGNTLQELRHCFYLADQERKGGELLFSSCR